MMDRRSFVGSALSMAGALADAVAVLRRWDCSMVSSRTVGACLKTVPADDARRVTRLLQAGGWLPPETADGDRVGD